MITVGSVVTKNISPMSILGVCPAKVLKYRNIELHNKAKRRENIIFIL